MPAVWPAVLAALLLPACSAPPSTFESPLHSRNLAPFEIAFAEAQALVEAERTARELDERFLEASDSGELAEHAARIHQLDIDSGAAPIDKIFRQGEAIFERRFTRREGLGTGMLGRPAPALSRVENAASIGGPDAISCRECHGRGGDDGHGELHQRALLDGDGRHATSARPRVPPHVAGLGLEQLVALEMTNELQRRLKEARDFAHDHHQTVLLDLVAKGLSFGEIQVPGDGEPDLSKLTAIDKDLTVKPFGWKGVGASLRDFVREALPQHIGLELPVMNSPRPNPDNDRDGVPSELHEGQLTSLVAYLALLDVPIALPPREPETLAAFARGQERFERIGCASCHVPELHLDSSKLVEHAPGGAEHGLALDVVTDNQVTPRADSFDYTHPLAVRLFSDLRRHDMGPGLAERIDHGVPASVFLTRPLWGLGDRGNYYLHDGRARSLRQAILLHGGEAAAAAAAYAKLGVTEQGELEVFLFSLRRSPQGRMLQ